MADTICANKYGNQPQAMGQGQPPHAEQYQHNPAPANQGQGQPPHTQEYQHDPAPLNRGQVQENYEERVFIVTEDMERMWDQAHITARQNIIRACQGLIGVCHPARECWQHCMLVLLLEMKRAEARKVLAELDKMEHVLGLEDI
ncbi:hypothetical protein EV702DRAFT_1045521 [Suillus placidus]|uniref:Uncharacterized protein n=1 Tax=Suillus placidus TaxID=48579 RepID=A0A9P7D2X1_9AGAM|nr:hypothetical protein EV702DRAFT_1045521 [Suillus placidus]